MNSFNLCSWREITRCTGGQEYVIGEDFSDLVSGLLASNYFSKEKGGLF